MQIVNHLSNSGACVIVSLISTLLVSSSCPIDMLVVCVCVRENVGSNECKDVELCSVGSQMKWNKGKKEKKTLMMMKRFTLYYIRCSDYDSIPKQQNDRISCKKVSFFELMFKLPCTHQYCIIAEKFVKINKNYSVRRTATESS